MAKAQKAPEEPAAEAPAAWTAERILALIRARHPHDRGEWAVFAEVRSHTGYGNMGRENYMDAFALGCWPSSGFTRIAYEIKVSRSDFMSELRDPTKRAKALALSNEMWFVAPSSAIRHGEVPDDCGWMEATAGGLRVRKAAPFRNVEPPPMEFIASLLRSASQVSDAAGGKLTLAQCKAFKFAGRDMTVAEMLEAARGEQEQHVQVEVERRLKEATRDYVKTTRMWKLAQAVAIAMGRTGHYELSELSWAIPTSDEFRMWLEGIQLGGVAPHVMQELLQGIAYCADASAKLEGVRKAIAPSRQTD